MQTEFGLQKQWIGEREVLREEWDRNKGYVTVRTEFGLERKKVDKDWRDIKEEKAREWDQKVAEEERSRNNEGYEFVRTEFGLERRKVGG